MAGFVSYESPHDCNGGMQGGGEWSESVSHTVSPPDVTLHLARLKHWQDAEYKSKSHVDIVGEESCNLTFQFSCA